MTDMLGRLSAEVRVFRAKLEEDMRPMVYVERDDHVVAILFAPNLDRDEGLILMRHATMGFGATAATLAFDGHIRFSDAHGYEASTMVRNPATDAPYQRGDLAALVAEGRADEFGITDVISLARGVRGRSEVTSLNLPYRNLNGTIEFMPEYRTSDLAGAVADGIKEAFELPWSLDTLDPVMRLTFKRLGIDQKNQELMQRVAITERLCEQGFGVMLYAEDDETLELYRRHLGGLPGALLSSDLPISDQTA